MRKDKILHEEIIRHGSYEILKDYDDKEIFVKKINDQFIEILADKYGKTLSDEVKCAGLHQLHKFVPANDVIFLQEELANRVRLDMLEYTYNMAKHLGLSEDFFLDLYVIARIKFPFEEAKKSNFYYKDYNKLRGRKKFNISPEITSDYHNNLPFAAWHHGVHADSWFGNSYDGINLWWSVDGVTEESGMTFYPNFVGDKNMPTFEEPPYLSKEYSLDKPIFFNLNPGDVICFNSDTLHGTRLNFSPFTRISMSTRLNPTKPRFDETSFRQTKLWLKSSNFREFRLISLENNLPSAENSMSGKQNNTILEELIYRPENKDSLTKDGLMGNTCKKALTLNLEVINLGNQKGPKIKLCAESKLKDNQKLLFLIGDKSVVVNKLDDIVYALDAICPHLGYNLAYGGHDEKQVYCPGHGLAFDWTDGRSSADNFYTSTYEISIENNYVFLSLP